MQILADKMRLLSSLLLPILLSSASGSAVRSADESAAIYLDQQHGSSEEDHSQVDSNINGLFNKILNIHSLVGHYDSLQQLVPSVDTGGSFQQQLIINLLAMGQIDQQLLNYLHNRKDLLFRQHLKHIESKNIYGSYSRLIVNFR
jgi:hypothetical protein